MRRPYSFGERRGRLAWLASSRAIPVFLLVITMLGRPSVASFLPGPSLEERLQRYGFATKTEKDIQAILRDDIFRDLGLRLLAERQGQQAIGTLKAFLSDKELPTRMTAASLLGQLGDRSGLPVMRQDYVLQIGSDEAQRDAASLKKLSPISIGHGLRVAETLAQLGDYRGYYLAVCTFEHRDPKVQAFRLHAVNVLGEIAKGDPEQLAIAGIDIRSAYDKAIDSVDDWLLFRRILWTVDRESVDPALASHVADRMLETRRLGAGPEMYVRDIVKPRIEQRLQQTRANPQAGKVTSGSALSAAGPASQPATTRPATQPGTQPATGE